MLTKEEDEDIVYSKQGRLGDELVKIAFFRKDEKIEVKDADKLRRR